MALAVPAETHALVSRLRTRREGRCWLADHPAASRVQVWPLVSLSAPVVEGQIFVRRVNKTRDRKT